MGSHIPRRSAVLGLRNQCRMISSDRLHTRKSRMHAARLGYPRDKSTQNKSTWTQRPWLNSHGLGVMQEKRLVDAVDLHVDRATHTCPRTKRSNITDAGLPWRQDRMTIALFKPNSLLNMLLPSCLIRLCLSVCTLSKSSGGRTSKI